MPRLARQHRVPEVRHPSRIQENFALFDFELGADDIQRIAALDKRETGRTGPNPDTFAYIPG